MYVFCLLALYGNDYLPSVLGSKSGRQWSTVEPGIITNDVYDLSLPDAGLTEYSSAIEKRVDAFNLLFDDQIIETMVAETNRKATATISSNLWTPTDAHEIRAFLGVLTIAGALNVQKRDSTNHWNLHCVLRQPIFAMAISKNRFDSIRRFIRYENFNTRRQRQVITVPNPNNPDESIQVLDRIVHIRDIFERFVQNCKKAYYPNKCVTVDEQLLGYRGKCKFKVYMASKPDKYGIKIWALCDSENFYVYNLKIYTGKIGGISEKNQAQHVVEELIEDLHPGHRITCDNFFTSLNLAESLTEKRFTLLGTIRRNKPDIPDELLATRNREVFSSLFAYNENNILVSYMAKKNLPVLLLTTEKISSSTDFNRRTLNRDGQYLPPRNIRGTYDTVEDAENMEEREDVNNIQRGFRRIEDANGPIADKSKKFKPFIILEYNRTKGGVDTMDQLIKQYPPFFKTRRWPFRVMQNMLSIAGINAYKLYSIKYNLHRKQEERWNFLINLSLELIRANAIRRQTTKQVSPYIREQIRELYNLEETAMQIEYEDNENCIAKKRR
ncbi:piggyBac transposable element-derived protein 4-like protein, partial [Dinothrombium tinctorium]